MKITSIEKTILGIIAVLLLGLIALVPFTMKACSQLSDEIESKGLKGITEELWEGSKSDNQELDEGF